MKVVLAYFWFIYWPLGWAVFFISRFGYLPLTINFITVFIGLIFYILKLQFINDVKLTELNYRTVVFDLLIYTYIFIVGVVIWTLLYYKLNQIDPSYFIRVFRKDELFYMSASKAILITSSTCTSLFIISGGNHPYKALIFTNKVAVLEIVFVFIALSWVLVNVNFTGMFISVIAVSTAPAFVKKAVSRIASKFLNRDINLLDIKINNNSPYMIYLTTPRQHINNIISLIIIPPLVSIFIHLFLILITIFFGVVLFSKHGG